MPKMQLPVVDGGTLRPEGDQQDARVALPKVKRPHVPRFENRKWTTVHSMLYPYDKIKNDFELQGLFTKMKTKAWMVIYFDMILMYTPTKEGPPSMDNKEEGRPFDYFFIDNIVDSAKIELDEAKLTIKLPTAEKKEDLKIICDNKEQFKEWSTTLKGLASVFETTPRDHLGSREEVDRQIVEIQKEIPSGFEPLGLAVDIDHERGEEWFKSQRLLYKTHRKYLEYISRVDRFSAYHVGSASVYCSFFLSRDRDGPLEILEATKKKVFAFWEAEVERLLKLGETVVSEGKVDKDHIRFHLDDCVIAVYYIDMMNLYSLYVHGVQASKVVLQKSAQQLEELWGAIKKLPQF